MIQAYPAVLVQDVPHYGTVGEIEVVEDGDNRIILKDKKPAEWWRGDERE